MKTFHINWFLCANFVATVFAYNYKKCYDEISVCLVTNTYNPEYGNRFRLNQSSADAWCKEKSSSLAIITNETVQYAIEAFMNDSSARIDSDDFVITNAYRYNQSTWSWTDNTRADIPVISSYYGYGFLIQKVSDGNLFALDRLATSKRKFICSYLIYSSSCPDGHQQLGMRCYKIHSKEVTWFDARNICLREGSDLATFEDGIPSLRHNSELQRREEYWIGLLRERWIWRNNGRFVDFKYSNWEDGQPSDRGGHCLCLTARTGKWTTCDCSQKNRFICLQDYASGSASTMIVSTTTMTTTTERPATTTTKPTTATTKPTTTTTKPITTTTRPTTATARPTTATTKPTTTTTKPITTTTKPTTATARPTTATTKPTTTTTKPTTTTTKPITTTTKPITTTTKLKTSQSTTTTISTVGDSSSQFQSTSTQTQNDDSKHSSGILALGIGSACLLILIVVIAVVVFIKNRRSRYGDVGPRNGNSPPPTMHNDDAPNTVYAMVMPNANEPVRSPSEKISNQTVYAELDLEPKRKITQRASEQVQGPSEKASNQAVYTEVAPKGNRGTTHGGAGPESEYANSSLVDSVYANSAQTKV